MSLPEITASSLANEVLACAGPVLIDFYGPHCSPCVAMLSVLEELAAERAGRTKFVKIDTTANPEIAARFHVNSVPNLVLLRDGQPIGQRVGRTSKADLIAWLDSN